MVFEVVSLYLEDRTRDIEIRPYNLNSIFFTLHFQIKVQIHKTECIQKKYVLISVSMSCPVLVFFLILLSPCPYQVIHVIFVHACTSLVEVYTRSLHYIF